MHRIQPRNNEKPFDNIINNKLGYYVYGLFDPQNGDIFYIGKAGGKEGRGNARVLGHFDEAKAELSSTSKSDKIKRIHQIWDSGQDVAWKILRSGLKSEEEAFAVEAALIDTLEACGHELLNDQGGHHSRQKGILGRDDIYVWAAPEIDISQIPDELRERPVFIFNIQKAVKGMWKKDGQPNYVDATKRAWNVSARWRRKDNAIAIGVVDGISRTAFEINEWKPDAIEPKRWEMVPHSLPKDLEQALKEKNFSKVLEPCKGYMQFGNYPIIKFPEIGDTPVFLRGVNSKNQ